MGGGGGAKGMLAPLSNCWGDLPPLFLHQRIVAERFDVSRSVAARLWRPYQETGEFTRREGQGRHRMKARMKGDFT